jgi:hypothetical protein
MKVKENNHENVDQVSWWALLYISYIKIHTTSAYNNGGWWETTMEYMATNVVGSWNHNHPGDKL